MEADDDLVMTADDGGECVPLPPWEEGQPRPLDRYQAPAGLAGGAELPQLAPQEVRGALPGATGGRAPGSYRRWSVDEMITCPACGKADDVDGFDVMGCDEGHLFCTDCHCHFIPGAELHRLADDGNPHGD